MPKILSTPSRDDVQRTLYSALIRVFHRQRVGLETLSQTLSQTLAESLGRSDSAPGTSAPGTSAPGTSTDSPDVVLKSLLVAFIEDVGWRNFEWRLFENEPLARCIGLAKGRTPPTREELAEVARRLLAAPASSDVVSRLLKAIRSSPAVKKLADHGLTVGGARQWRAYLESQVAATGDTSSEPSRHAPEDLGEIRIVGTFERGGTLHFKDRSGRHLASIDLSRGQWAVMAILMRAARDAEQSEFAAVSPTTLCQKLMKATRRTPKPLYPEKGALARFVCRLRERLRETLDFELVRTVNLGYRVRKTDAKLVIHIQDEEGEM